MSKKYYLSNGLVFDTEAEVKAYIRGLEVARSEGGYEYEGFTQKMSQWIEEANVVKNAGPTDEPVEEPSENPDAAQAA